MVKTVKVKGGDTNFLIRACDVAGVTNACDTGGSRVCLNGVFVEKKFSNAGSKNQSSCIQLTATDGKMLLTTKSPDLAFINDGALNKNGDLLGFIIGIDVMEKAFKKKVQGELWINGDTSTGIAEFLDIRDNAIEGVEHERVGVCDFEVIDEIFPDYNRITKAACEEADEKKLCAKQQTSGQKVLFNGDFVPKFMKAYKTINGSHSRAIAITSTGNGFDPLLVSFSSCPQLLGVLMPIRP